MNQLVTKIYELVAQLNFNLKGKGKYRFMGCLSAITADAYIYMSLGFYLLLQQLLRKKLNIVGDNNEYIFNT